MNNFFQELRKRGVIRVASLYAAVVWLLLQASDVLFPAFEIPDAAVKLLLAAAVMCLPFVLAFAWFYELTDQGIQREEAVRAGDATRLMAGNEIYYVMITILVLALSISVYMNFRAERLPPVPPSPISILISDFDNQTEDPIFTGSVEQALIIGIEGASFITSYARNQAIKTADLLQPGTDLDEGRARLVAVREGISLVLAGSIVPAGQGFKLTLKAIDPKDGELVFAVDAAAENKLAVLQAVASLAAQTRESLGDVSLENGELSTTETFSAASLSAVHAYTQAQNLAHLGQHEQAAKFYEQAIEEDPEFGRAYSGWALSEFKLGHQETAENLWTKTLTLLNGMTEREKYRTLGLYYVRVTHNYEKAIENYSRLVKRYPADGVAYNNLAVSYFYMRRFDEALQAGKQILDIFPNKTVPRSNYALYAMYAGDFDTARAQAEILLAADNSLYKAYLPLSMASMSENDPEAAKQTYQRMAAVDARGASLAAAGLADIALTEGEFNTAVDILTHGITVDLKHGNTRFLSAKYIALAEAYVELDNKPGALASIAKALSISQHTAQRVPAALMYLQLGEIERATQLANQLGADLQPENRAYAALIRGNLALSREEVGQAVDEFRAALQRMDMWLVRLNLGKAYLHAGYHAEAMSEFEICQERLGEATALFLDDMPTFHHSAELYYWLGRAQHELGIAGASSKNLQIFLSHRRMGDAGQLVVDARSRLTTLTATASATILSDEVKN